MLFCSWPDGAHTHQQNARSLMQALTKNTDSAPWGVIHPGECERRILLGTKTRNNGTPKQIGMC